MGCKGQRLKKWQSQCLHLLYVNVLEHSGMSSIRMTSLWPLPLLWRLNKLIFLYPRSPKGEGGILFYLCPSFRPSKIFFVALFSVTVDGRDLIFGHKLHIGSPYRGKHFWTHHIPTTCLPTLLIFIHIEHICSFFVAFCSATIDGRDLIFGHKLHIGTPYRGNRFLTHLISTSCLPTLLIFIHIEHICSFFVTFF
jgi:hypothetical protein